MDIYRPNVAARHRRCSCSNAACPNNIVPSIHDTSFSLGTNLVRAEIKKPAPAAAAQAEIIDLSNLSQVLDADDDVILVSSNLIDVVDLCTPARSVHFLLLTTK